jgi:hypothetical protein
LECKRNGGARDERDDGDKWNKRVCGFVGELGNEWGVGKHGHIRLIRWVCDEWKCGNERNERVGGFVRDKRCLLYFRKLRDDGS